MPNIQKRKPDQQSGWGKLAQGLKILLGILVLVILFIPLYQAINPFASPAPLKGYQPKQAEMPELNLKDWLAGRFQADTDSFVNENFPLRPFLVRVHRQLQLELFNKAYSKIEAGKNNYFFGTRYMNAYLGKDFLGTEEIRRRAKGLLNIQNTLKSLGKDMCIILLPSSPRFYPEHITARRLSEKRDSNNYDSWLQVMAEQGLHYADFSSWFAQMKDTASHPLFPQAGVHWSPYGQYFAIDSMIGLVEQYRQTNLKRIVMDSLFVSDSLRYGDYDLGDALNLLYPPEVFPMAYPIHHYEVDGPPGKARVLTIGDSFFWGMVLQYGLPFNAWDEGEFWYYNQEIVGYEDTLKKKPDNVDAWQRIMEHDMLLLVTTTGNLAGFPWLFDDSGNQILVPFPEEMIWKKEMEQSQLGNWLDLQKEKAAKAGISLERQIRKDVTFMLWREIAKGDLAFTAPSGVMTRAYIDFLNQSPTHLDSLRPLATQLNIKMPTLVKMKAEALAKKAMAHPDTNRILLDFCSRFLEKDRDLNEILSKQAAAQGRDLQILKDSVIRAIARQYTQN